MSLPVRTDALKYSLFPRTITDWNSFPLAVRLSQIAIDSVLLPWGSAELGILQSFADHHDTTAVTGGLHPLLDISPKNEEPKKGSKHRIVSIFSLLCKLRSTKILSTAHLLLIFGKTIKYSKKFWYP